MLWSVLLSLLFAAPATDDFNIAPLATVEPSPAMAAKAVAYITDGNPTRGGAYDVRTEGPGTLTFTWPTPRALHGAGVYVDGAVYTANTIEVRVDTTGDGKLDRLVATLSDIGVDQWTRVRFDSVQVHAVALVTTAGQAKGARAYPVFGEVELLGPVTAADQWRMLDAGKDLPRIWASRSVRDRSSIEQGITIIAPPAFAGVAQAIRERLSNASVVIADDRTRDYMKSDGLIVALGHAGNNPLIGRLYFTLGTMADATLPGDGGYLLQTVIEPYGANPGQDVVIIAGNDPASIQPAIDRFIEHPQRFHMHVHRATGLVNRPPTGEPTFDLIPFLRAMENYLRTGDERFARYAVRVLDRVADGYDAQPDRPLPWSEETSSWRILAVWDVVEDMPLVTADQRVRFTNLFLHFMEQLRGHTSGYAGIDENETIAWNHTTFPLLGMYFGARNIERYYPTPTLREYMIKARHCFTGQLRSWKPQEDADGYLTLTNEHAILYGLGEWQLDFFTSGLVDIYGDYVVSMGDHRGRSGGFGDSGLSQGPHRLQHALPILAWWTRDPGLEWVARHVTANQWRNPFHPDVRPAKPDRFTGMRVFPLDRQLYDYTVTRPFYRNPVVPVHVPADEAFDKIALRSGWDDDAQYLLLDGYSRGKHLHYDGNAINQLNQGGERWLIDHDYLIRNTTEHNMMSVIRDGRSDKREPPIAGVRAAVELDHSAFVETYVPDYIGIDWTRRIFWRKGIDFVVVDEGRAVQAGRYDMDVVWKGIDRASEVLSNDGRVFSMRVTDAAKTRDVVVIDDEDASGGQAVVMNGSAATLAFEVDLPAGEMRLTVHAFGRDTGSDSLWISADGGQAVAFHLRKNGYGPSNEIHDHSGDSPTLRFAEPGSKRFRVTLRENPPVRIDWFEFDVAGEPIRVEAETLAAQSPTSQPATVLRQFHIASAYPTATRVLRHAPQGIAVPVVKLYQRLSGDLQGGESRTFASWLHSGEPTHRAQSAGENVIVTGGPQPMAVMWGKWQSERFTGEGGGAIVTPNRIDLFGVTKFQSDVLSFTSDTPVDASHAIDEIILPEPVQTQTAQIAVADGDAPEWLRSTDSPTGGIVNRVRVAPLETDGEPRLLVAQDNALYVLDCDANPLWHYATKGTVRDVAVAELDAASPGYELLVTSRDCHLHMLSAEGKLLRRHEHRGARWNENLGDFPWALYNVAVGDLTGDGRDEIVYTTLNYEMVALDRDFNKLWMRRRTALHGSMHMTIATLTPNEPPRVVMGDKYGRLHMVAADGSGDIGNYTSIGDVAFAIADLNGDGAREVVHGSSTGDLRAVDAKAKALWEFNNFGYAVIDLTAWGNSVVLLSETGYVYRLAGDGGEVWRYRCASVPRDAVVVGDQLVVVDEAGGATLLDDNGEVLQQWHVDADLRHVVAVDGGAIAVSHDGRIVCLNVR